MTMQELTQLSSEELQSKLTSTRQELFSMREQVQQGKEKNHAQLKALKADVARIFTALKAKEVK